MKKIHILLIALIVYVVGNLNVAWAGLPLPPVNVYSSETDTTVGIGLRFDFGDMQPEVVGTVRHTNTNKNNNVVGILGEISLPLMGDKPFVPAIRVKGLVGVPDVQGLAGVGYDFAHEQALVTAGVQGPYVEGGVDYLFSGDFAPYLGVNSYDGAPERNKFLDEVLPPPPPE